MASEKEELDTARRLSLPDLTKLKDEWERREAIQATAQLTPGKLQVTNLNTTGEYVADYL